jgi:hypothetical protein
MQNGKFIDSASFHPESMSIVQSHELISDVQSHESMSVVQSQSLDISIPTTLIFHIRVTSLTHPASPPANYPEYLTINLEEIRQILMDLL